MQEEDVLEQYVKTMKGFSTTCIKWTLSITWVPWWGGQFERMVCLVKNILKVREEGIEGAFTNIETMLRNTALTSIEEDIQFPVLTPNLLVLGRNS